MGMLPILWSGFQKISVALIQGFGIKTGAIASSIAHDSHNLVVVGADDESMVRAASLVVESFGGIAVDDGHISKVLQLPIAGLMSNKPIDYVADKHEELNRLARQMGSSLKSPMMTLSFMALLVIPSLKLSDKGLFDSSSFTFVENRIE